MTPRDFCYWLQGFFEVSEAKTMSPRQFQMVKNHLAMAQAHSATAPFDASLPGQDFCQWLHSGCSRLGAAVPDENQLAVIRTKLNSEFKHVIDPTFGNPAHQSVLDTLHQGGNPDDMIMRC